jgi:secreted trypsin-like serine protease
MPVADAGAISGGRPAPEGSYASAVVVEMGPPGTTTCGGTLIAPTWVLTAGHCVLLPGGAAYPGSYVHVIAGRAHRSNEAEGMSVEAARVIPNPSYVGAGYVNVRYPDVALVELTRAVPYPTSRVAGPSERALWSGGTTATAVGWGTDRDAGSPSETLNEVDLEIHSDDECASTFGGSSVNIGSTTIVSTSGWDRKNMLCAGDGAASTCSGDSGGPLFVPVPGPARILRIAGVVSEGGGCPSTGIFTRVGEPAISSWIASLVPGSVGP